MKFKAVIWVFQENETNDLALLFRINEDFQII